VEIVFDNAALEHVYLGVFWFFRVVNIPALLRAHCNVTGIVLPYQPTEILHKPLKRKQYKLIN
jgi:hypothetical protein